MVVRFLASITLWAFAGSCLVSGASLTPVSGSGFTLTYLNDYPQTVWSGGALLTANGYSSAAPVVTALDSHGAPVGSAIISVPGAKSTSVRCMARGVDGSIVGGGSTTDIDGHTAEVLAIVSANGPSVTVSSTTPFAPKSLAVAPDGTIWVQGFIGRNPDKIADADPAHGLVRHFDRSGKMIGSFVPEAGLNNRLREMEGYLAVSADKVGWISQVRGSGRTILAGGYIEISSDGSVREYPLPAMKALRGFVLTDSGEAIADVTTAFPNPATQGQAALVSLDREHSAWLPMQVPQGLASVTNAVLLGQSAGTVAMLDTKSKLVSFFGAN